MVEKLRRLGFIEGSSLLILLLIAMPIKYILDNPIPVRIIGGLHGGLFVLFVIGAVYVGLRKNWTLKKIGLAILISTLPAGPFLFDKTIYGNYKKK